MTPPDARAEPSEPRDHRPHILPSAEYPVRMRLRYLGDGKPLHQHDGGEGTVMVPAYTGFVDEHSHPLYLPEDAPRRCEE